MMTTNTFPTYDQLMQPTLDALHELGGQATNQQIYDWILARLEFPEEIVQQAHKPGSSLTEVGYRLMWARTYLRQVGLIDSVARATWVLTETGRQTQQIDPAKIARTVKLALTARNNAVKNNQRGVPATELADIQPSTKSTVVSLTPSYPRSSEVRQFLQILDGVPYLQYREMSSAIWAHRGSPQEQVDWTTPDEWIPERLSGQSASLALKLWHSSRQLINPRYTRGSWYFVTRHELLERNSEDYLEITQRGREFIAKPSGELEARIDQYEGILLILQLVAEKSPARRRDLIDGYAEFCRKYTTSQGETTIQGFLYDRLRNLSERQLITARGQRYEITTAGLDHLKQYAEYIPGTLEQNEQEVNIHTLAKQLRDNARNELYAYLLEMDPYKFESLVKLLLEEIGYTDVVKTSATNDKGVDVIAQIELGITSVREVIQVKRHRGSINRVVLDQLRGSLHRFNAVRGSIITTGSFSRGAQDAAFERGAAPITLIDGEKVLDLLMEYQIGIKKKAVDYYEFAPNELTQFDVEEKEI